MSQGLYIPSDHAGRRLDRVLRTLWPQVPLSAIMKAIRTGEVRLNEKKASPERMLVAGDFLQVPWDDELRGTSKITLLPQDGVPPLDTLYRDELIWIVNKPLGLLSQPDTKDGDSVITRALRELNWTRADFQPATVHRLDRNTSGIITIALEGQMLRLLTELIRTHKIKKTYWAIVSVSHGILPAAGEINAPLRKDEAERKSFVDPAGKPALTRYRNIRTGKFFSVAELEIVTGRSHQARAHLASIGFPIFGDRKYGGNYRAAKRPMLHARAITFPSDPRLPHALQGATFTAPVPPDMTEYTNGL